MRRALVFIHRYSGLAIAIFLVAASLTAPLMLPIHGGRIAGFAGGVPMMAAGLVIVLLSITGIVLWREKRGARRYAGGRTGTGAVPCPRSTGSVHASE